MVHPLFQACRTWDGRNLGASSAVALLGAELVADAGGLPEAAAELAQALRTPRLVACVADGAIGPWGKMGKRAWEDFGGFLI